MDEREREEGERDLYDRAWRVNAGEAGAGLTAGGEAVADVVAEVVADVENIVIPSSRKRDDRRRTGKCGVTSSYRPRAMGSSHIHAFILYTPPRAVVRPRRQRRKTTQAIMRTMDNGPTAEGRERTSLFNSLVWLEVSTWAFLLSGAVWTRFGPLSQITE